jgi:hypothetical protein
MKSINLSVRSLSKIFWEIIYLNKDLLKNDFRENFFNKLNDLERLRSIANYNTGSISLSSAFSLFLLIKHFKPMRILEIGTFIGKSTISMASEEFLKLHNFHSNCLLGLLVPLHEFRLTNQ